MSGPLLTYNGVPVTAGQFGAWTPLGAEWTGNGYAIAWKMGGIDQYTVWNIDSGGNYVSQTAQMFGSSSGLEVYEPILQQDINGDGRIGVPPPAFNIDVAYSGDQTYQSYFIAAAQRWQQVITGDLPGFNVPGYGFVDDLHITASVGSIDGRGGILGQTRVEYYRTAGGQPISAFMTFDSADLATMAANGTLSYVILHEMGHALGLGQGIWSYDGLTNGIQLHRGARSVCLSADGRVRQRSARNRRRSGHGGFPLVGIRVRQRADDRIYFRSSRSAQHRDGRRSAGHGLHRELLCGGPLYPGPTAGRRRRKRFDGYGGRALPRSWPGATASQSSTRRTRRC